MRTKVERGEDTEDDQCDDFLDHLELDRAEVSGADAVGRNLEAVLEEGNAPTYQDDLPQSFAAEPEVAIPGKSHEDVGDNEQKDGPHRQFGCARAGRSLDGYSMTALKENFERLEEAIEDACRAAGRPRAEVELMAVSKTYQAATIAEAAALGLRLFGENRVQEFAGKATELEGLRSDGSNAAADEPIRVHLIGHLQSNKALRAAELFDAVDAVDSVRLAERLDEAAAKLGKRLPILIEVKLSPEETKAGLDPESAEAAQLLERLPSLAHLHARGLMTIAPWGVARWEERRLGKKRRSRWAAD